MNIDWKLWLAVGGLTLSILGSLIEPLFCHWIPSATGRATCGEVATVVTTLAGDAKLIGDALGDDAGSSQQFFIPGFAAPFVTVEPTDVPLLDTKVPDAGVSCFDNLCGMDSYCSCHKTFKPTYQGEARCYATTQQCTIDLGCCTGNACVGSPARGQKCTDYVVAVIHDGGQ